MPMRNHEFPIAVAARRSGLTAHVIRAWEKRYGAILPSRSGTKRRLYSEKEIERLRLLHIATQSGHSIGNIAALPDEALRLLASEQTIQPAPKATVPDSFVESAIRCVESLDAAGLERSLNDALVVLGRQKFIETVVVSLVEHVGHAWEAGELRVAHEHFATTAIRTILGGFIRAHSASSGAPVMVAATPQGQIHELGALIAAATATDRGWSVVYLGPSLPPEELAAAVRQRNADALALSIVYPADDPLLARELRQIRKLLPEVPILVGGRAARGYGSVLSEIAAIECRDIRSLAAELDRLREIRPRD